MRRLRVQRITFIWLTVFVVVAWLLTDADPVRVLIAAAIVGLLCKIGFAMIGGLAQPIPEPPPAGELRKVRLVYRCSLCGTEVRMTTANDDVPEAPRHCMEDMDLIATADDML
jgi:hypothetical protein